MLIYICAGILLVVYILLTANSGEPRMSRLFNSTCAIVIASIGQALVHFVHGIDLSAAGLISFSNCAAAIFMPNDPALMVLFIFISLIIGGAAGFLNGYIITHFKLPPFIVTFASWFIWEGIAYFITPIKTGINSAAFSDALTGGVLGIPVSLIIMLIPCILWTYAYRTHFGISLHAIAQSKSTAYYCGIRVTDITIAAYALCGLLSVASGILIAAYTQKGAPSGGDSYLLLTLCAVFLGGTSFKPGSTSVFGTVAGCFVLQIFIELILLLGVPIYWAQLLRGLVFIFIIFLRAAVNYREKSVKEAVL